MFTPAGSPRQLMQYMSAIKAVYFLVPDGKVASI